MHPPPALRAGGPVRINAARVADHRLRGGRVELCPHRRGGFDIDHLGAVKRDRQADAPCTAANVHDHVIRADERRHRRGVRLQGAPWVEPEHGRARRPEVTAGSAQGGELLVEGINEGGVGFGGAGHDRAPRAVHRPARLRRLLRQVAGCEYGEVSRPTVVVATACAQYRLPAESLGHGSPPSPLTGRAHSPIPRHWFAPASAHRPSGRREPVLGRA